MVITFKRLTIFLTLFFIFANCSTEDAFAYNDSNNSEGAEEAPVDEPRDPIIGDGRNLSNPLDDPNFSELPDGKSILSIKVSGRSLSFIKGSGSAFTSSHMSKYNLLKEESQLDPNHKVHWSFMDLDKHKTIASSAASGRKIFGASSSKIYVAATLLDKQSGSYTSSQLQKLSNMLVVSSNSAWTALQREIGDGDANLGRELNYLFTQRMGYPLTRGWQGYWGDIHGNELVPDETVEMLYDTYMNQYAGAEVLWKLMHTCRTGATRGKKYIPSDVFVGGKTGTYDGPTENPATGEQYNVKMRNHVLIFNIDGHQYGLAIYANDGSSESVALLAGGLIREYAGVK